MMVAPGVISPACSAASIMDAAARSLMLPPGLKASSFTISRALSDSSRLMLLTSSSGVWPIRPVSDVAIFIVPYFFGFFYRGKVNKKENSAANSWNNIEIIAKFVPASLKVVPKNQYRKFLIRKYHDMATVPGRLDATDIKILRLLQQNARLTLKEIGAQVNLSSTPVYERFRRLEREGFIKKYVAVLDVDKLDMGFTVFCSVKLNQQNLDTAEAFATTVRGLREVTECYNISGRYDYLLKIQAASMKAYRAFVLNVLGQMEEVASFESTFVMDELKHDYGISI